MPLAFNSATYLLLFVLLANQPNPGAFPAEAKMFQGLGLALGVLLVLGQRGGGGRQFSVDASDALLICLGALMALATFRPAFLFFTASLAIAKQVLMTKPRFIPVWAIVISLSVSAVLTMRETQHEGRWALMIGDPNFSAIICLIFVIGVLRAARGSVAAKLALALVPIGLIVMTVSRMGVLCVLLSLFVAGSSQLRSSRRAGVVVMTGLFALSIVGPVLAGLAIQGGHMFTELQGGDMRYFALEDSSNLSRILGYLLAVDHMRQGDVLLLGDAAYTDKIPDFVPLPHNWFLGGIVSYGAVMTVAGGLYLYSWRKYFCDGTAMAFFGIYLLAAGMLNVSVLTGLFAVCLAVVLSVTREAAPGGSLAEASSASGVR